MERLSIPFKPGQRTTRPNRRVVSTSILIAIVVVIGALAILRLLIGRSTLLSFVPKDAEAITIVGQARLAEVSEHLGTIPLLPGRFLTLQTILPNVRGEAGVIGLADGSRIVAYRGVLSEQEEKDYRSYGIAVKKEGNSILLATDEAAFATIGDPGTHFGISSVLPGFSGFWREAHQTHGLYRSASGLRGGFLSLFLPKLPHLPSETVAFVHFSAENQAISSYLSILAGSGVSESLRALLGGKSGDLLLVSDEQGVGYRLTVHERIDSQVLAKVLQASVALASPTTKTVPLPDGSYVDELEADPAGVVMSVEELADGVFIKADQGDLHLRARQGVKETVITNREALLVASEDDHLKLTCGMKAENLVLSAKLAALLQMESTSADVVLGSMHNVKELLISAKKFSICW